MHVFTPVQDLILTQQLDLSSSANYNHILVGIIRDGAGFDYATRKDDADMTALTPLLMSGGNYAPFNLQTAGGTLAFRSGATTPQVDIDVLIQFASLAPSAGQKTAFLLAYFGAGAPAAFANKPIWARSVTVRDPAGQTIGYDLRASAGKAFLQLT